MTSSLSFALCGDLCTKVFPASRSAFAPAVAVGEAWFTEELRGMFAFCLLYPCVLYFSVSSKALFLPPRMVSYEST
ncbi:hypothetical protein BDV37DRAFT_267158 [Aspergillus pseudonomiae]|uniref:Uncharacterized protein n=1 Tax=Aspergillus pseudonomiae TaxID=1506151 RepID=A0A5N7CRS0_9EURO|nr:uncharacterized protein BDV37DRAFT_267158 [Aspergillus pseudonomiae]KAE8396886.1 hypothetical protein BDV37DRAFT_267158 [Aspergillus pseudonomiae]